MKRTLLNGKVVGSGLRTAKGMAARAGRMFEELESRQMLTVNIDTPIGAQSATIGATASIINLAGRYDDPNLTGTIVRFNSVLGSYNVEMFDQPGPGRTRTTPQTVTNFLDYVNQERYNNLVLQRSVPGFVLQAGGYTAAPTPDLVTPVPIFQTGNQNRVTPNEPGNTNARGTIAMARVGGQVNSATSQWFVNTANNAGTAPNGLDFVDQGFTVFGRVIGNGLTVVDALAAVPNFEFGGDFANVPLRGYTQQDFNSGVNPRTDQLVTFSTIEVVSELTYTVTSSNNALVRPTIVDNRLVLNYGAAGSGPATITVRVTSAGGDFVEDSFTVTVAATPPTVGRLDVSPARIAVPGDQLTLTASGTDFQNPQLTAVSFFRDSNRNGVFDAGVDTFLDADTDGSDGYSTTLNTADAQFGFTQGGNIIFARGTQGATTVVVAAAISVNAKPVVGLVARTPQPVVNPGDNVTLNALDTFDRDGTVARVQFFRDTNGNNIYDSGVDTLIGEDTTANDGFSLIVSTTGFPTSTTFSIFAIATDDEGAASDPKSVTMRVNALPTITTFTASAQQLIRRQAITLTAAGVADVDSARPNATPPVLAINRVDFFRDSNNDGILQTDTDQFLGQITTGTNGSFSFTVTGTVTGAFPAGNIRFFASAVDSDTGRSAPSILIVPTGNAAPTLTGMTATPAVVANIGGTVTLAAQGPADNETSVASVRFYRDADGNGIFDVNVDIELGRDTTPANGFSLAVDTSNQTFGFTSGTNRYFAVAVDTDGETSIARTATNRLNAAPTIAGVTVSPNPLGRAASYTLTAGAVADTDGTIARVEFYRDINGNDQLDIGTDTLLGSDTSAAGGYTFTGIATNFPLNVRFFARAVDNENGVSTTATIATTVQNSKPRVTSLTATPNPLSQLGGSINLTAVGVTDTDGTIAQVQFYRDADGNGVFDAMADTLLGSDQSAAGGYTLTVSTGNVNFGFATGANRFFAVAVDNDGDTTTTANAATTTVRINEVPAIAGLAASPDPVGRLQNITLTATGVLDQADSVAAGTIVRVEFYRDSNANGTFDLGTDALLGVGVRQGTTSTYTLTVSTAGFAFGSNRFFVRAQDNNLGFSTPDNNDTTTASVTNNAPTLTSVTATPNPLASIGSTLTLTAAGAADRDGTVASVRFYRDADNDGVLDTMVDTLLGTDASAVGGFTLAVNTGDAANGFATGTNRYFAVAVDNDGATSTAVTTTSRVNSVPTIGTFTASGPTLRGANITLTATNVVDTADSVAAGTILKVEFYRDVNGNGTFEPLVDRLLGVGVRQTGTTTYVLSTPTTGFGAGTNTFFVRAQDNNLGFSTVDVGTTTTGEITNRVPTFTSLTALPNPVTALGQTVTLTAVGVADVDGTVTRVDFYRDVDGDGALDTNVDTLLGSDNSAVGGYALAVNTGTLAFGFTTGTNRYLAQVVDNNNGVSAVRTVSGRINAAPVVGSLTTSGPVTRGNVITLVATNVTDTAEAGVTGTITRVDFYLDSNANGTFEPATDRLLGSDATATAGAYGLTIATTGFPLSARFFARAVDNNNGQGTTTGEVATATASITNNAPTLTTLTAAPNPVTALGGTLTLTASGFADRDGTVTAVQFFRDADGNNLFDANVDTLLGTDNSAVGGYTLQVNTGDNALGFTTGVNRYFARAVDNNGDFSTPAGTQGTTTGRVNARPTIGAVANSVTTTVARGANVTYTASNVVDTAEAGFTGSVTLVQFYLDVNANGTIEAADRLLGTGVRQGTTSTYVLTAATTGFAVGSNTVLARATDNNTATSLVSSTTFTVVNAAPLLTSTTAAPATVAFLGQNLTITANGARDTDGTVSTVLFFFDTNNDGVLQPEMGGDLLLGEDASAVGGYSITVPTLPDSGFHTGAGNRVFACVVDNNGDNFALPATFTITANNALPTIGGITTPANPVNRNSTATVSATTVADGDGTVGLVEFYRDVNGDGVIQTNVDQLLGSAVPAANQATLTFSTRGFDVSGPTTIMARPRDNRLSYGNAVTGTFVVQNLAPTVTSVTAAPNPVLLLGNSLVLTAAGVADADGTIANVQFYYDSNNDGSLDTNVDTLVGTDNSAVGGYTATVNTGSFSIVEGSRRFFVRVTDNNGGVATTFVAPRINARPVISSFDVTAPVNNPPILRSGSFTLSVDVTDDVSVTSVQLYRDLGPNFDNTFTAADVLLGTATRVGTTNTWTFTRAGTLLPAGTYKLYARAVDGNGQFSAVAEIAIAVV